MFNRYEEKSKFYFDISTFRKHSLTFDQEKILFNYLKNTSVDISFLFTLRILLNNIPYRPEGFSDHIKHVFTRRLEGKGNFHKHVTELFLSYIKETVQVRKDYLNFFR